MKRPISTHTSGTGAFDKAIRLSNFHAFGRLFLELPAFRELDGPVEGGGADPGTLDEILELLALPQYNIVDPSALEKVLLRHKDLKEVEVLPSSIENHDVEHAILVAYIVPVDKQRVPSDLELQLLLSAELPNHVTPVAFIAGESLLSTRVQDDCSREQARLMRERARADRIRRAAANVESILPLSPAQRGILYYSVVGQDESAYLEQLRVSLEGDLQADALRRAWELVVSRHGALRSQFAWEHRDKPLQVVRREVEIPWTEFDFSDLSEEKAETSLRTYLEESRRRHLSLDRAPLLRLALVRRAKSRWEMVWTFHHLLIDGWSMGLVYAEVWSAYRAFVRREEPELPPAVSLRSWIAWLSQRDDEADREYWREALDGLDEPFDAGLPGADVPEGESDQGEVRIALPAVEVQRLTSFARQHGLTLNAVAVGAWALLLQRYTGRPWVAFGTVVAGRPAELPDVERAVGVFMNALPVWTEVPAGARVADWLSALQECLVDVRDHAGRSLEEIQEWAGLPIREPIFDTLLVFENYPVDPSLGRNLEGVKIVGHRMRERGAFPVSLYLTPRRDELVVWLDYRRDRLNDAAAGRLLRHYLDLLGAIVDRPEALLSELQMLSGEERGRLLGEWVQGGALAEGAGETPVYLRFAERARETPEAVAVVDGDRCWTYRELAARAAVVTERVRALPGGVFADDKVALLAGRSAEMLAGLLGILGAGAAYVPLDGKTPAERIALVLEDAGVKALVTDGSVAAPEGDLPRVAIDDLAGVEADPALLAGGPVAPESAAYVIYTSGSTGRPKGVVVSHRNLDAYVATAATAQGIVPGSRVLQFASIGFDTSVEEIWPCLTRGGTLVLRDDRVLGGPEELGAALREWRPEVLDLPTAFWHEMAAMVAAGELELPESLRLVILGGEKALAERVADWRRGLGERADAIRIDNTYGPTETTIVATSATLSEADAGEDDPPIGRAVAGARAYVLGPDLRVLPYGVAGELVIGGAGVARGYLDRPALTAARFVPDPSGLTTGARLYRTGDLVAFRADGQLEFRGRIDDQVKIRGFRVEPGEVAAVLAAHADLRDVAVTPWSPPIRSGDGSERRDLRLIAYVVAADGREVPRTSVLRAFAAERLPEYMVPSVIVALQELPRTTSGKLNRRALPEPEGLLEDGSAFVSPRTPVEELLAGWWCEMLSVKRVSRDDDFFRLGGHSLLVGRLAARVRKELGVDLSMVEVFENPVLVDLAARIETPEKGKASGPPALPPIEPTDRSRPLPLSYQQERVWFFNNLVPDSAACNFHIRYWLRGTLDVNALERALTEIVRRQEIFRTTFPDDGGAPVQVVDEPWEVKLPVTDLTLLGREAAEECAEGILKDEVTKSFDVTELPLVNWRLIRIAKDDYRLIQVEHYFLQDAWSVVNFLMELKILYQAFAAGELSTLEDLEIHYGDFAVWQRNWMRGEAMDRIAGYWRRKLKGAPNRLDLPSDRPRPSRMTLRGDAVRGSLPKEVYSELLAFGRREGFTLYMTMMASFQVLVHRYTGQQDFLIGTGISNRRLAELKPIVGMMMNSLVIRGELGGDPTFRELLERVRKTTLEAYAHQDMPFERLVEEIQPERDASRNPLFQVMFSLHDVGVPDLVGEDLRIDFIPKSSHVAQADLNVVVVPTAEQELARTPGEEEGATITWEFSTDLFDENRIRRLIEHYYRVILEVVENPGRRVSEVLMMPAGEEAQIKYAWSGKASIYPQDLGLGELFERQAMACPDRLALRFRGQELSYAELNRRSTLIAKFLAQAGVSRGTSVALAMKRSLDLVPVILGVIKAGACYVPLDVSYPKDRISYMLSDSGSRVLVVDELSRPNLEEALSGAKWDSEAAPTWRNGPTILCMSDSREIFPADVAGPSDAAYVIYTSGTTGAPKGVVVPHGAVVRLVLEADYARFGPDHTFLQLAPISFDAATLEIWAPLLTGGALVLHSPEPQTLEELGKELASERITTLWLTAGLFREMVDMELEALAPLRQLLSGGDVLSPVHCRRVLGAHSHLTLINGYGPTENTTFTTCHVMRTLEDVHDPVPIGRPIAGTDVMVVDSALRPVAVGLPGELVARGKGLAWGYRNSPSLTAARFVPDPLAGTGEHLPGSRIYRTGDVVRLLVGGELEFRGRLDHQVKIRDFRVEPGEVEAALQLLPEVEEARVLAVEINNDKSLVAFVVPASGADRSALELSIVRTALATRLPAHMMPAIVTVIERFPLLPSGKVDYHTLIERLRKRQRLSADHVEPRSEIERILASIWFELLPVSRLSIRDDFFDLGGHSLTAIRMFARIRKEIGVDLPLIVAFEERTVERLARVVEFAVLEKTRAAAGARRYDVDREASVEALLSGLNEQEE